MMHTVRPITLRGMSRELEHVLRRTAAEMGGSLNRAAIALLERGAGLARPPGRALHHDLDHLAGTWNAEEADSFDAELAQQRRVDRELWK
jgi:hypothetical protein